MRKLFDILTLLFLAGIFGYSGMVKLLDLEGAALSVYRYHLLPSCSVNILALWLGALELWCSIALLIPRFRKAALWLVLGLLIIFSLAIGINLMRGSQMTCGCFSTSPMAHPIGWLSDLKNFGLIALVICAFRTVPASVLQSKSK